MSLGAGVYMYMAILLHEKGGIHGDAASSPHQAPLYWIAQWNNYRLTLTNPLTKYG